MGASWAADAAWRDHYAACFVMVLRSDLNLLTLTPIHPVCISSRHGCSHTPQHEPIAAFLPPGAETQQHTTIGQISGAQSIPGMLFDTERAKTRNESAQTDRRRSTFPSLLTSPQLVSGLPSSSSSGKAFSRPLERSITVQIIPRDPVKTIHGIPWAPAGNVSRCILVM